MDTNGGTCTGFVPSKIFVHAGVKCDNEFRSDYLSALEKAMTNHFPGTDFKGDQHIQYKIYA